MEPSRFSKCCFLVTPSRARRVRFGPPDRLSPLGEVYLQPTLNTGHWTGEGGSRERGGEKMVWEPDRFNARVAHRLRGRPRFELIKARDLKSLATQRGGEKMVREPDRFNARVAHRLRGRPRFELIKARDLESLATLSSAIYPDPPPETRHRSLWPRGAATAQ